jgi:protease secretion system membrane fusion protein
MSNIIKKPTEPAADVITHDVEPLTVNTDAGAYAKLGWFIVLFGVIGFLLWASLAPLDKGVPLSGYVAKEGNRKTVQYPTAGIVQDILVHDGDVVKAGQVLVRMNDVQASSAMQSTLAQYIVVRATEARLAAELRGAKSVPFPPELAEYKDDPRVRENVELQTQLFNSRQLALQSELSGMSENIAGLSAQAQGLEESRESKKVQLGFLKEQLDNSRDLAKEGYIPRSRLLELERTYAQINGAISEDVGNAARARRQVAELNLRRIQRTQEYQKEVRGQLSDAHKEAEALAGRIKGQKYDVANVDVKSPVDGVVVGSNVFTKGGVVAPGAKMMEIVPSDDALVVEGQFCRSCAYGIAGRSEFLGFQRQQDAAYSWRSHPGCRRPYRRRAQRRALLQGTGTRHAGRRQAGGWPQDEYRVRYAGRPVREDRRAHHDELSVEAIV